MAILKHFASKSSNYGASLDYVLFDHDEKSGKVLRDANGNRILRRSYWLDGVNCDPFLYAQECKTLPMWREYYELTMAFFDSKTLSDLADLN